MHFVPTVYNKCILCMLDFYLSWKPFLVYSLVSSSLAFPTTIKTLWKLKLDMRSLSCSGVSVLQHQYLLSLQAVTRNWQKKREDTLPNKAVACSSFSRQACVVIIIISGYCSRQMMRWMYPGKSVRYKSKKKQMPLAIRGCFHDVFVATYFRCTARMHGNG